MKLQGVTIKYFKNDVKKEGGGGAAYVTLLKLKLKAKGNQLK